MKGKKAKEERSALGVCERANEFRKMDGGETKNMIQCFTWVSFRISRCSPFLKLRSSSVRAS